MLLDPTPHPDSVRIPARDYLLDKSIATATFNVDYILDGEYDLWQERCYTFPDEAKIAVNRATTILGNMLRSTVPITIKACWVFMEGNVLGYSGGQPMHRELPDFPQVNTWYQASLGNALSGTDIDPSSYDMHIAMNKNFNWYFGLDANPASNQVDFVTVMLHEILHGLNFSGTMELSNGSITWGHEGYPNIYDVFMYHGSGNQIINTSVYPNPSSALTSAVTSDDLWFHGINARTANGNQYVKMYAPATWSSGSSYSHLDYTAFVETINRMMVYRIASGDAVHDPGPVAMGLLQDLGWELSSGSVPPEAEFRAQPLHVCKDISKAAFTDLSTGSPTSWGWTFMPETITYADGTSGTSRHPVVTFNQAAAYSVALRVENEQGSDTATKTDYITVADNCHHIRLDLTTDDYPDETTWELADQFGAVMYSGGPYSESQASTNFVYDFYLPAGQYVFRIFDSEGDGICCEYGHGRYSLQNVTTGEMYIDSGGQFENEEINQFEVVGCGYAIRPTSSTMPNAGGTGSVTVSTTSGCAWTASSSAAWITIASGASGIGVGSVSYTVAANETGTRRTGLMTIAGRTFTVVQFDRKAGHALSPVYLLLLENE